MSSRERQTLTRLADELIRSPKFELFSSNTWAEHIPASPGVYVLWDRAVGRPIYVGETSDLRERMRDLGRFPNHICRRKLAVVFEMNGDDEPALSAAIARTHALSYLEVQLGRLELEEYLSVLWARSLINRPGRRHLERYEWVEREHG